MKNHHTINHTGLKIFLKNGYNILDARNQTLIQPDGIITKLEQWDISYYEDLYNTQQKRGLKHCDSLLKHKRNY